MVFGVDADGKNPIRLCSENDFVFKTESPNTGTAIWLPRKFTVLPPSGDNPESLIVQALGQPSRSARIPQYLIVPTTLVSIDPQNGKDRILSEADYPGEPFFD